MNRGRWYLLALVAALVCGGCSGILAQEVRPNGQTETLRLGTTGKWSTWDRNPLKDDDSCLMLKKVSTF